MDDICMASNIGDACQAAKQSTDGKGTKFEGQMLLGNSLKWE